MEIYKLFNYLFGWDYIHWRNSAGSGVARVELDGDGVCYYWRYKNTKVADKIKTKDQVLWLTCKSEKYLGT